MNVRVSSHTQVERSIARFQGQSASIAELQDQISSGIRLSRPSVDPTAYVEAASGHTQTLQFDAYQTAISDASTTLNVSVSAAPGREPDFEQRCGPRERGRQLAARRQ